MGVDHYENFPVASLLAPAHLRPAIRAIYRFARTADDIADEGDATPAQRLADLAALQRQLDLIESGAPAPDTGWPDLADAVRRHGLSIGWLRDLLSAFAQDVTTLRYDDDAALHDYCRRSANPVGRLILELYGRHAAPLTNWADGVCTGLQLANFWQDVAIDWSKGRVYLPRQALAAHGVDEHDIAAGRVDERWRALMRERTAHARALLEGGTRLPREIGGRAGWELRLVIQGGLRILERIDQAGGDVFGQRPVLKAGDWATMTARAWAM
jgi:squalene synthase HpnC